jgi:hypothetical protein
MSGIRQLSETLAEIAKNELNETPERLESELKALKKWVMITPHIYANTDDQFLTAFLRGCKFSLEKAKLKLDTYYTLQTIIPEMKERRDPLDKITKNLMQEGLSTSEDLILNVNLFSIFL